MLRNANFQENENGEAQAGSMAESAMACIQTTLIQHLAHRDEY